MAVPSIIKGDAGGKIMPAPAELDAAVQDALRYCSPDISEDQRVLLREDLRLQFDYPGHYVAFLDDWVGANGARTLTRRVIHAGPNYPEVWEATKNHPRAEEIFCVYADDPFGDSEPLLLE
jgi:hypothetical protein